MDGHMGNSPAVKDPGPDMTIIGVVSFLIAFQFIIVALRFWARRIKGAAIGMDDWLVLVCLPFQVTGDILAIWSALYNGLGRPTAVVLAENPHNLPRMLLKLYITEFVYITVLTLIKLSIVFLYYRVFPTRFMKRATVALGGLCIAYWVAVTTVTIFQCTPIKRFWDPMTEGHCLSQKGYFIGGALPNILIDVLILALPIVEISKLQMRWGMKASITGIFLLGGGVVVVSCIRLSIVLDPEPKGGHRDYLKDLGLICIWTKAEQMIAMLCASLPPMQPLFQLGLRRLGILKPPSERSVSTRRDIITIGGSGSAPKSKTEMSVSRDGSTRMLQNNDSEVNSMVWVIGVPDSRRSSEDL